MKIVKTTKQQIDEFIKQHGVTKLPTRVNERYSRYLTKSKKRSSSNRSSALAANGGRSARAWFDLRLAKVA